MSDNPVDVSILMLTYYHEKYVAQAIESVLMQRTPNLRYELLIADDASGDRTQEIIREYAARYPDIIKPILRTENVGATNNGSSATRQARGKYKAYLEGDDFWIDPDKLQKQFDFLEAHPEFSACCGKCIIVDENGVPDYTQAPQFVDNRKVFTLEDHLKNWQLAGHVGTVMQRIYREGPDYSSAFKTHRTVGDKTNVLLTLMHGPIYCSNEILSAYRKVNRRDAHNHFSQHYANQYRDYDLFAYPCRLEHWAKKNLGIKAHLGPRRDYRFCRFVRQSAKTPSWKRAKCIAEMIVISHQPMKYLWLALKTLIEME